LLLLLLLNAGGLAELAKIDGAQEGRVGHVAGQQAQAEQQVCLEAKRIHTGLELNRCPL